MTEHAAGLFDTSVVIDHDVIDHDVIDTHALPQVTAIAAITLAELATGLPVFTRNPTDFEPAAGIVAIVQV